MLPIKDPPQNKRPTKIKSEGLEKSIPSKWTGKKAGVEILVPKKKKYYSKQKP